METLTFCPFAYALLDEEVTNYCWYCLKDPTGELRKCTGCRVARFCNKDCLAKGWLDHKAECKAMKRTETLPNVEVRMLGRIVVRYKDIQNGKAYSTPNFWLNRTSQRKIMEICAHAEEMRSDHEASENFSVLLGALKDFYGVKQLLDDETIFQLHARNFINRHAISDRSYLKEIGKGLYLDLCAYNHSCAPNVIYTCDGFVATLRPLNASVSIRDKSQTFYTYVDLLTHKDQRRKMLKDTWYFRCECKRCMDPAEHILTSMLCSNCQKPVLIFGELANKDLEKLKLTCTHCLESQSKERVMEAVGAMRFLDGVFERNEIAAMSEQQAKNFLKDMLERFSTILPPVNIYLVRLVQAAIGACPPDDKASLLRYHLLAEDCLRVCFPENHPSLAMHLMNIGIFFCQLDRKKEARPYLEEAKKMVEFGLGPDHSLLLNLEPYSDVLK